MASSFRRGGPLRLVQIKDNKQGTLYEAVAKHVDAAGTKAIMTDDAGAYNFSLTKFHKVPHSTIRHSRGEYVKGTSTRTRSKIRFRS